jgi:hypothetical protein
LRLSPAIGCHQIVKSLADGWRGIKLDRPAKVFPEFRAHSDENDPRAKLRNSEVTGIEQCPGCLESHLCEFTLNVTAIVTENRIQDSPHVLNHHGFGVALPDDTKSVGKQIPLITVSELFARHGKRGTWQATGKEVYSLIGSCIKGPEVLLEDSPRRTVCSKSPAAVRVNLDERGMIKTRAL